MSKKKFAEYLEFPLPVFVKLFPIQAKMLQPLLGLLDSTYIVRYYISSGRISVVDKQESA